MNFTGPWKHRTPSLPDADPRSDRPRCDGRESKFLEETLVPFCQPSRFDHSSHRSQFHPFSPDFISVRILHPHGKS